MARHRERRRSLLRGCFTSVRVRAALALGILLGVGAVNTSAYWTDRAELRGGILTAGTLDIKLGVPAVDNNPPQFRADLAMDDMVPGSRKDAVVRVSNAGTVPLVFSVSGTATNNGPGADQMGSSLRLAVYPSSSGGTCTGTPLATDVVPTGRVLADQPELGDGDIRDLCVRATLPDDADAAVQGQSTQVTLTFHAKQVGAP